MYDTVINRHTPNKNYIPLTQVILYMHIVNMHIVNIYII